MLEITPNHTGVVESSGCPIHYWSYGPADAPAIVLTHGVTVDHHTYEDQITALHDAGYRVIVWDMRGHGVSRPAGKSFTIDQAVADLLAILDEASADEAVFVGQSFGGFLIQEFYRRHPERVAALILVGAYVVGDALPLHQRLIQRARPAILRWWPEAHLRKVIPLFLSQDPEVRRYVARATHALSKDDFIAVTRAALEPLLAPEPLLFSNLPVLIVYGEAEMGMIRKMIRQRGAHDQALQVEVVEGGGHLINQERPEAFNDVLIAFLRTHVPVANEPSPNL